MFALEKGHPLDLLQSTTNHRAATRRITDAKTIIHDMSREKPLSYSPSVARRHIVVTEHVLRNLI